MHRDATMIDVALTKNGKTALALKDFTFIVLCSTQQEVTKNNKSNLGCTCLLSGLLVTVRGVFLLLVCTELCSGHIVLCVGTAAKPRVSNCAGVLQTINWVDKC